MKTGEISSKHWYRLSPETFNETESTHDTDKRYVIYTTPNSAAGLAKPLSPEELDLPQHGSDRILLVTILMLMIFGLLAVYSSIAFFAETRETTAWSLLSNHMIKIGLAVVVMLIFSKINYRQIARYNLMFLILSWILLIAVLFFGDVVFGARRSLSIGGISFQPSMMATAALLIHVSSLLSEKQAYIKDAKRSFLPILFWVLPTCALIGLEDFSSAGLLLGICLILMVIGRISLPQMSILFLIGAIGAGSLVASSAERQSRVQEYIQQIQQIESTELDRGAGYQAQQSYIAIAQGQLAGVGIGKSTQRNFLPAPYNDFIYSIITEEYGLIGAFAVLILFVIVLIRGIAVIARRAEDSLGILLATACTLGIVLFGFVNAMVASGLLPVTGLPMPFVSYGGTSSLISAALAGILLNISKHTRERTSGVAQKE
ncbi:MAG: FtsW/RodA/SpoVE family cell cycle protein [Bacteroidota bacterium]